MRARRGCVWSMWTMASAPATPLISSIRCVGGGWRTDSGPSAALLGRSCPRRILRYVCGNFSLAPCGWTTLGSLLALECLPAIVCESLVGFRHLVRVFPLLHGPTLVARGGQDLVGELLRERVV